MKLINSTGEYLPKTESLTLDELFEEAGKLGHLETGCPLKGRGSAELRVIGVDGDYIKVSSSNLELKGNIAVVIEKAKKIRSLYREINS